MEKIEEINEWLKNNRLKGIKFLQLLVQERSTRGEESRAQAIIVEKLRELGLQLDIWEIGNEGLKSHPHYCSDRDNYNGNPNVVGVLKGTGGGRSIILNGHIDVVPEGDLTKWEHDPYSGVIKKGRLYGRGATDMKGGTVSLLMAIEAIQSLGIKLKGDVIFQSVIEEESGGAGTLAAVLRGYRADGAIIPEPTNMKLFPKQQGSMWFRITVKGRAAHGGTRYEGISAIEKMIIVVEQLKKLEEKRNEGITDPLYAAAPIPIPINIGKFYSGEWPSSVPDIAVIEGRIGIAPNETIREAEKAMESFLMSLGGLDDWFINHPPEIEWFGGRWLPGNLDSGHELMEIISASFQQVMKKEPRIEASPWGTDGGILSNVGKIPVVVFGPGVTGSAHETNEYIVLEDMISTAQIIALSLLKWCGSDDDRG
ncbi:peptidase [Bacillus benzoevorans]|uniref:Acetylornithine deacetylase n=1 Tax=Bacillus benzoevorans TaxID=1456 RepID=A0A7X0HPY0_9BACI|nr:peptidase [Bacillus benzoevorans]MBB6444571.1 acetylornithine deacetylase [Bacillus benzoevorans]